jgi:hypothetical protein
MDGILKKALGLAVMGVGMSTPGLVLNGYPGILLPAGFAVMFVGCVIVVVWGSR